MKKDIQIILSDIKRAAIRAFALLDAWFDREGEAFWHVLPPGGRPIRDILLHTAQTNRLLLARVEAGSAEALRMAQRNPAHDGKPYDINAGLPAEEAIGELLGVPAGPLNDDDTCTLGDIRHELRYQLGECLCQLDLLKDGQGRLVLPADGLPALDVYQHIYLVALNTRRQVTLLCRHESAYSGEQAE